MLPAELKNVAIDEDLEGDRYGILFKDTPPDELVEPFVRYNTVAILIAVPESETEPNELFQATYTEIVELPDGTEAQLRYMEPVEEMVRVNHGSRCSLRRSPPLRGRRCRPVRCG